MRKNLYRRIISPPKNANTATGTLAQASMLPWPDLREGVGLAADWLVMVGPPVITDDELA
jgi:hypothetical protein